MMWFVDYIRRCFCGHEFKFEEIHYELFSENHVRLIKSGPRIARTCNKCGWHKSYWKF